MDGKIKKGKIGKEKFDMRIISYIIMPNHWHLVLHPKNNGDLSKFMGWITNTYTRRWHTAKETVGQGHLYQGRYKSFICQDDNHFLTLVRYVERNAKKDNLVKSVKDWQWSSLWRRENGNSKQKELLSEWPIDIPKDYINLVNMSHTEKEIESLRSSINKGKPYGYTNWIDKVINRFSLGATLKNPGRPKKGS